MSSELRTELCRTLGIEYPLLSVGFAAGARAELVAAVSNAGGFGVLGASAMSPDALRASQSANEWRKPASTCLRGAD